MDIKHKLGLRRPCCVPPRPVNVSPELSTQCSCEDVVPPDELPRPWPPRLAHGETPPSADVLSDLPTPSTPDSVDDLPNREKICVLNRAAANYCRTFIPSGGDCFDPCSQSDLVARLKDIFVDNGIPVRPDMVPSKKLLFDLRDKLESDISNLQRQMPTKEEAIKAWNSGCPTWKPDDIGMLVSWAREGRNVVGTPPKAPLRDAQDRLDKITREVETMKLRVQREQRLTNAWRGFVSRVKVLARKPQVTVDVESSLLNKRLQLLSDQFGKVHAARMEIDLFFKTILGTIRDSGAMETLITDIVENKPKGSCLPTLSELLYWLQSYVTVLADGSIPKPCDPLKEDHPTDVAALLFQLVKCIGPEAFSDLAKLKKLVSGFFEAILVENECKEPFQSTPSRAC